ncbi:MAG TPA: OB-fold domain-containing protein [Acidimicrobiales bacterium]|nr:OB-fold domain-containing protein [Acidimicrobiales bacterium]
MASTSTPVVEGWLFVGGPGEPPALIGLSCTRCTTVVFPPTAIACPNPRCQSPSLEPTRLSRSGRIWSYTDAQYQPPPPYVPSRDPYQPFAIAAVELEREKLIVLGQVAEGYSAAELSVGGEVELVVEPIEPRAAAPLVWRWRPTGAGR